MLKALSVILLLPATMAMSSLSLAQDSIDWRLLNASLVDRLVIPSYREFAIQSANLEVQARQFCEQSQPENFIALQQQFHAAMDAWQAVQHFQSGPITYFNWNYRIQYWPDEKGSVGRQMDALLAAGDEAVLELDAFARQSVGVQGFPALERLLFTEDAYSSLSESAYRCHFMQTISANLSQIAASVHARWVDEYRETILEAGQGDLFESDEDAGIDFLKALVETLPRIRDQKLSLPMGENFARSRVRQAESWRSARSIHNIAINLRSLYALYDDGQGSGLRQAFWTEDRSMIDAGFTDVLDMLGDLPGDFSAIAADESLYQELESFRVELDQLFEAFETSLKNTDLYLGFNSLDGD